MKAKNFLAAVLAGTVFAFAPATGIGSQIAPSLGLHGPSIVYAAKGGVRIAPSAPKAAPAAPKATSPDTHKSVSGNGGSYAPSKSAKDLEKNAPAAKSGTGMMGNTAQSGSRFGSMMRNIGLFAGGMFLGSMLSHLFGFGMGGMMADVFGLLANVVMVMAVIFAVRWLFQKLRGNGSGSSYAARERYDARPQEPQTRYDARPQEPQARLDVHRGENGASARDIADRYRGR